MYVPHGDTGVLDIDRLYHLLPAQQWGEKGRLNLLLPALWGEKETEEDREENKDAPTQIEQIGRNEIWNRKENGADDSATLSATAAIDEEEEEENWDQDQATAVHGVSVESRNLSASPSCTSDHPLKRRKSQLQRSSSTHSAGSAKSPSRHRRPSLSSVRRRSHSSTSSGKIMADLLPERLDGFASEKSPTAICEVDRLRWRESSSTLHLAPSTVSVPSLVVLAGVRRRWALRACGKCF